MKKKKKIDYLNSISKKYLNLKLSKKSEIKYSEILKKINKNIKIRNNIYHSLSGDFKLNFRENELKKFIKFETVVIIGMGGSINGAEAIYYFLKNRIKKNFIFVNNIDNKKIEEIKSKKNLKKILFLIISKSGNTIETISNTLALNIIKKNCKNIIIISEKNNNALYLIAKKMNLHFIEHKKYIGGRYSVLSEVSMVPAYLMGLSINKIRKNSLIHFQRKNNFFLKQSSILMSNLLTQNKYKNIIFFDYCSNLNKFLFWAQQLIAESLGKKGKGFLPTISLAPQDHHSLLQLYLDGPKDKLFYIFSSQSKNEKKLKINKLNNKLKYLNNKSLNQIKIAQKNALIKVLKKNDIPFREFKIKENSEQTLGELFSYFMLETIITGKLANINPFDQPAVESVKAATNKILS